MNVVAFVAPPEPKSSLEGIAQYINKQFARMERAETRASLVVASAKTSADNARVRIGRALIEARDRLKGDDPHASFDAWCEANVNRSRRDCYTCMRLAGVRERLGCMSLVTGAEGAVWDQSQSVSGDQGTVPDRQSKRVQTALGMYRKMTVEEREEVKQGQEEIDNA
jgi:hypothetical protein